MMFSSFSNWTSMTEPKMCAQLSYMTVQIRSAIATPSSLIRAFSLHSLVAQDLAFFMLTMNRLDGFSVLI